MNIIFSKKKFCDTIVVCRFDKNIEIDFSILKNELNETEGNDILSIKNEVLRRQKMAGRVLLKTVLGETGKLEYNEHGKPLLKSHEFDISFSHCKDRVALMLSNKTAGIDIQDIGPKIRRIVHKFMNIPELNSLKEENYETHATLYWCAKEALYKAYGERQLIFTDNIIIEPFSFENAKGNFKGTIKRSGSERNFILNYKIIDSFALVYIVNE